VEERLKAVLLQVREAIGLRDVFCFGGIYCIARGLVVVYEPAAWIVVGALLF
jgi:hypothetical protein